MDYKAINKAAWDKKTKVHVRSNFYDNEGFKQHQNSLNQIELDLIGDVSGKRILHLQCHFGQDSISLAKLGADVVGIDLSGQAIAEAKQLAEEVGVPCTFIESDVYGVVDLNLDAFDMVFTTYGTIGWLPDLDRWATVISKMLKPGGQFVFVEFHPFIWTMNSAMDTISYDYFKSDPIVETETDTYTDDAMEAYETVSWNHAIGEVLTSLLSKGGVLNTFQEIDFSPYPCFANLQEEAPGKWRFKHLDHRIPMVYALRMTF